MRKTYHGVTRMSSADSMSCMYNGGMLKHYSWVCMNWYGWLFGWPVLAPFHSFLLYLSVHGLGYDNSYRESFTGERRFIRRTLARADIRVCLDIGANIGGYSELLAQNLEARIYAIEPAADSFSSLTNVADRHERITPIQSAIADFDGTAPLFSKSPRSVTATLDKDVLTSEDVPEEVVIVQTLDTLVRALPIDRIDFIKIDTEGFEREVLRGATWTLATYRPRYIQFEFNILHLRRGYTLRELTLLLPHYDFYRLLPHGMIRIDPNRFAANIFMFSNIIAARQEQ